ncbi:putative Protein MAM3 [Paratrimastix pyriformis]|uniref:DUF21-domain-containing protein n=1 Tax=Paratrimastix pyriformis TaxID=342808 RepID=A0ABQ8UWJ4_9EUKA|nr:putative Protein MAM3 [Paratrimastix pyriformis]
MAHPAGIHRILVLQGSKVALQKPSGLTLAYLSFDITNLRILKTTGTPKERRHATRVEPLLKRRHLLLVTLVLTNVLGAEALPIFFDKLVPSWLAILLSVTAILLVGEILPQALFLRFRLTICAWAAWLIWGLFALFYVVAWPISKVLDFFLGKDHATGYSRSGLKELAGMQQNLTTDEVTMIHGVLELREKVVADVLTPLEDVFMLSLDHPLDQSTMSLILSRGHSRIPVYDGDRSNIVGMLLVKRLIAVNPADARPIRSISLHPLPAVEPTHDLFSTLNEFQQGRSHMAVVREEIPTFAPAPSSPTLDQSQHPFAEARAALKGGRVTKWARALPPDDDLQHPLLESPPSPSRHWGRVLGIVTLEDVIEELIKEEIEDETSRMVLRRKTRPRPPGDYAARCALKAFRKWRLKARRRAGRGMTTPASRAPSRSTFASPKIAHSTWPIPTIGPDPETTTTTVTTSVITAMPPPAPRKAVPRKQEEK